MKICRRCGCQKPLSDFYRHAGMTDGHLNFCKDCTKQRVRRHRADNDSVREYDRRRHQEDPERRKKVQARAKLWREQHPERYRAQTAVNNAIRDGRLTKPKICEREGCGSDFHIHAHHEDYSRPLDVEWLCARCHQRHHAA